MLMTVVPPSVSCTGAETAPEVTVLPSTVIEASLSVAVGVNVTELTEFAYATSYDVVPVANAGLSDPVLRPKPLRDELKSTGLVTDTEYVRDETPS